MKNENLNRLSVRLTRKLPAMLTVTFFLISGLKKSHHPLTENVSPPPAWQKGHGLQWPAGDAFRPHWPRPSNLPAKTLVPGHGGPASRAASPGHRHVRARRKSLRPCPPERDLRHPEEGPGWPPRRLHERGEEGGVPGGHRARHRL